MLSSSKKPTIVDSGTLSEKSPLMNPTVINVKLSNSNSNDNDRVDAKHTISFAQLRPFLKIAIPYFRHNRSGIIIIIIIIIIVIIILIITALCTLCGLLFLTIMDSFFSICFSYTKRNLLNALGTNTTTTILLLLLY